VGVLFFFFFFGGEIFSFFNKEIGQILGKKKFKEISTNLLNFCKISPKFQHQKMKKKRRKKREEKHHVGS